MQEIIPVVLATDENYALPTSVAILSLMENISDNVNVEFYLLIPSKFSYDTVCKIEKLEELYPACKIYFIDMKDSFQELRMQIKHITLPTYYRLLLAELLPNYDKCIYLDGDLIAMRDILPLYQIDISGYYIAGVKAPFTQIKMKHKEKRLKLLGIDSYEQYVNAGVLLINLKKIREDELTNKMLELVKKDFPVQDQDILNVACYGKILNIPLKYNMMIECYRFSIKQLNKIASTEEIEEARRQPVIYHFATQYKPWKYNDIFNYVEWNQFFEKSPLYITLKRKSSKMDKILFFLKRCYTFPMRKFRSILNK